MLPEVGFSNNESGSGESSRDMLAGSDPSEKNTAIETENLAIKNASKRIMETEQMRFASNE